MLYNFLFELRYHLEENESLDLHSYDELMEEALNIERLDMLYQKLKIHQKVDEVISQLPPSLQKKKEFVKVLQEGFEDIRNEPSRFLVELFDEEESGE